MGRKYQNHERYEENFVTFAERHLSSSSIGGGRIPCSSYKRIASSDLAVPTICLRFVKYNGECANWQEDLVNLFQRLPE